MTKKEEIKIKPFWYSDIWLWPKLITIITTLDKNGTVNAGPYSHIMQYDVMTKNPRMLIGFRQDSHTFVNIEETGEFVVNCPSASHLDDMMETMYHANGIGLAATQIAIDKRLIVMDCGKTKFESQNISEEEYNEKMKDEQIEPNPIKMINPEIISLGENLEEREEGCLSIPGYNAKIKRPSSLKVKYTDENKKDKIIDADGLLATCIQHEIDHLNGILFIDHLSKLKREIILKKAIKEYSKN